MVVDDEAVLVDALERLLSRAGARVIGLPNGLEALRVIEEEQVEVALLDIKMPHISGLELLSAIKQQAPSVEVIMMTAHATVTTAVQAVKDGAYDYLQKPFPDIDEVIAVVGRAIERGRLARRNRELEQVLEGRDTFEGLVGQSKGIRKVYEMVESVAYSSSTVLIRGESGTGKELVAKALHNRSPRSPRPFIAINCTAVPETLLESELFGHVKGAFTGAANHKVGLFEAADGGTLMLDEIGDLPGTIQAKILRVLQDGEIRRVGSTESKKVDVRIVAATNVDLEEAQRAGRFREDLYYRLNVIPILVPPLRERSEDIPLLSHHFLRRVATRENKRIKGFTRGAMEALAGHRWIGNVRELENVVERSVVLCRDEVIGIEHLPDHFAKSDGIDPELGLGALSRMPFAQAKQLATDAFERRYLQALLQRTKGNVSEAARFAGMDRSNFRRVLKRYDLRT